MKYRYYHVKISRLPKIFLSIHIKLKRIECHYMASMIEIYKINNKVNLKKAEHGVIGS
jgi:hypothetical protein